MALVASAEIFLNRTLTAVPHAAQDGGLAVCGDVVRAVLNALSNEYNDGGIVRDLADRIAWVGLAIAIIVSPWAFGSVRASVQCWLMLLLLVTLLPCAVLAIWVGPRSNVGTVSWLTLPLFCVPLIGWWQRLPLNASVYDLLSPRGLTFWKLADQEIQQPGVAHSLSLYPDSTLNDVAMLSIAVTCFVLSSLAVSKRSSQMWLCGIAAVNGAVLAVFGIVQRLTFNGNLFWIFPLKHGGQPFASFVNRNHAGGYFNLCVACALGVLVWTLTRANRGVVQDPDDIGRAKQYGSTFSRTMFGWLSALNATSLAVVFMATMIAAGVVFSLSRGAILSFVVATMITAVIAIRERRSTAIAGLAVLALLVGCLLALWLGQGELLQERLSNTVSDFEQRTNSRIDHWQDVMHVCRDFWPTGSGIGTYRYVYRPYESHVYAGWYYHAENHYLEAFVEAGFLGLVLILACIALVFQSSIGLLRRRNDHLAIAIGFVGLYAIASQAVHGLFDFGMYMPANAILCATIAGFVVATIPPRDVTDNLWVSKVSIQRRIVHGLVLVSLVVWLGWSGWKTMQLAAVEGPIEHWQTLREPQEVSITEYDSAIENLSQELSRTHSQSLAARQLLADLYVLRYRRLAQQELMRGVGVIPNKTVVPQGKDSAVDSEVDPADSSESSEHSLDQAANRDLFWDLTAPSLLYRRASQLKSTEPEQFESLRNDPLIRANLVPAVEQLLIARNCCALDARIHLKLAELYLVAPEWIDDEACIMKAVLLSPYDPNILYRTGLLDLHAGRTEAGAAKWKRCLTISTAYLDEVLATRRGLLTDAQFADWAVPDNPERLVQIARRVQSRTLRSRMIDKAERTLDHFPLPAAMEAYVHAAICELRFQYADAIEYYKTATSEAPDRIDWRAGFAALLGDQERYDEAVFHATRCVREAPRIPAYRELLKSLTDAREQHRVSKAP